MDHPRHPRDLAPGSYKTDFPIVFQVSNRTALQPQMIPGPQCQGPASLPCSSGWLSCLWNPPTLLQGPQNLLPGLCTNKLPSLPNPKDLDLAFQMALKTLVCEILPIRQLWVPETSTESPKKQSDHFSIGNFLTESCLSTPSTPHWPLERIILIPLSLLWSKKREMWQKETGVR